MSKLFFTAIPNSIQKKFLLISLFYAGILIFFFILLSSLSIKNASRLSRQYADNTIQKTSLSLSSTFQNVLSVASLLSHGYNVEHYLLPKNDYDLYTQHLYLSSTVNSVLASNDAITNIILFRSDSCISSGSILLPSWIFVLFYPDPDSVSLFYPALCDLTVHL